MEDDFLAEMSYNGVTARLKRLSDAFLYQTKEFYTEQDAEIEPNWHMVFLLLEKHGQLTVTEMASQLGQSHPALVKLTKKMKRKGYLISLEDENDRRKYQLTLSDKARAELPLLHRYWEAGDRALREMMDHHTALLDQLAVVEKNMADADFKTRMHHHFESLKD
ncbi:DNA-binding MarR family transcriptional regulator [Lewinella aquimaris]|uniref:DNA-binding MarR family transcriptional regulator n=1 Tax=Neolewinella aquimaris TaxID=1835722 RepID=A0A840E4M7_9BACT|nr:MarR family transcriptional regulator [Neolewinella aquimaris]MBB4080584.1 DNA-binding MarR family transcriptional regulator [Neolewinella aquimaris]